MLKLSLWLWCLGPLVQLGWLASQDALGANPQEALLRGLGQQTLMLLWVVLSLPWLKWLTGPALIASRRMLGLWCYGYAVLHLLTFWQFEHDLGWLPLVQDIVTRPFVTLGVLAVLLLTPLALTSNRWSMLALGPNWKRLHQAIWLVVGLTLAHYFLHKSGKNSYGEPLLALMLLGGILLLRRLARGRAGATPGR